MLYNSMKLIASHFDYCSVVWDTCGVTEMEKLQVLQNRSAKIINGTSYYSSATEALAKLNWDPLKDRFKYNESITMYKVMNELTPSYLKNRFELKNSGYALRGYKTLVIPKPKTDYKKRSFSYRGAKLWNDMDTDIKQARSVHQFKQCYSEMK